MKDIELHFNSNELSMIVDALESYKERIKEQTNDSAPEIQNILAYIESVSKKSDSIEYEGKYYTKFSDRLYELCESAYDIYDLMKTGEYCQYYDRILIKTKKGIVSCDKDLNNGYYV